MHFDYGSDSAFMDPNENIYSNGTSDENTPKQNLTQDSVFGSLGINIYSI